MSFSSYLRDKGTKKRGKLQIPEVFIHIRSPVSLKFQKARSKISRRNRRNTQKILKVIYNAGNGIFKNILYIEVDKKAAFIVMVLQF